VYGERDAKGNFSLAIPVDTRSDDNTLKLQVYALLRDPESQLVKPFPLGETAACMVELCKGGEMRLPIYDSIMGSQASEIKIRATQPVKTAWLKRSALYSVADHNAALNTLNKKISDVLKTNDIHVPTVAEPFVVGLAALPHGGAPGLGVPPVFTHYGALSSQVDGVDRSLPHAMLAYFLQIVVTHYGGTIEDVMALPDRNFAQIAGDVLWGLTSDADGAPYESDRTLVPAITLNPDFKPTFGLKVVTSEDIGAPFAHSTFIGRDTKPQERPQIDLQHSDAKSQFLGLVRVLHGKAWEALCRALLQDDCETSAMAGMLAKNLVRNGDMSAEAFRRELEGFSVFKNWTDADFKAASDFCSRLKKMIRSGVLDISLVVGLAGGAAANTENVTNSGGGADPVIDSREDLGGHCFAVLRYKGDEGPYVRLLEGTTCMRTHHDRPDGIKYTVSMGKNGSEMIQQEVPMSSFLTILSSFLSLETQVVNRVIGGGGAHASGPQVGVQGPQDIPGFVRPTIVTPCLHSLNLDSRKDSEMGFYKWCLYTGLTGDSCDVGTLPLDDLEYREQNKIGAGCRPAELASQKLRGVGVEIEKEQLERGRAILNEVWPPLADRATFQGIMNLWEPLPPLTGVNKDLGKRAGVSYVTVTCMETPASHALVDVVYRINKIQADITNSINLEREDSDGIIMVVNKLATGVHKTLLVPETVSCTKTEKSPATKPGGGNTTRKLTFANSLREAKVRMGWAEQTTCAGLQQEVIEKKAS
jgi:hypothetical protein